MQNREEIWIITPYFETGRRLAAMAADTGVQGIRQLKTMPQHPELTAECTVLLYQKERITETLRVLSAWQRQYGCRGILLLDPDKYARFLDAARAMNVKLLMMPVSCRELTEQLAEIHV